jgi:hypothetical protein
MDPEEQEEQSILDLEESNEGGIDVVGISDRGVGEWTITDIINDYMQQARYTIVITKVSDRGLNIDTSLRPSSYDISQMLQDENMRDFFSDETIILYNKVSSEADINSLSALLTSADKDIRSNPTIVDRPTPGSAKGSTTYSFNSKIKSYSYNVDEVVDSIDRTLNSGDYKKTREAEKKAQDSADVAEYIGDEYGTYRSSHPYWGYKTDRDGLIPSTDPSKVDVDGNPEKIDAPFAKGSEYRNFIDMSPHEIFQLQKRLVLAGMDAPTTSEYGQWSEREAKFMSAVFIRATDTGNWEEDLANGVPLYETTLTELEDIYTETSEFADLYQKSLFLEQQAKANPGQIKDILDQVSEIIGINFTDNDYLEFANEVNSGLATSALSQKEYEDSLITDRDIILGTNVGDFNATPQGKFPLYLPGSSLPLVVPGYDILRQEKGEIPQPLNSLDVITENLKARPDIQREMSSVEALDAIKYSTNLFEASMGQIELGDS